MMSGGPPNPQAHCPLFCQLTLPGTGHSPCPPVSLSFCGGPGEGHGAPAANLRPRQTLALPTPREPSVRSQDSQSCFLYVDEKSSPVVPHLPI